MIRLDTLRLEKMTENLPDYPMDLEITVWIFCGITGTYGMKAAFEDDWSNYEAHWCCHEAWYCVYGFRNNMYEAGFTNSWLLPEKVHVEEMEAYWGMKRGWKGRHRILGVYSRILYLCSVLHTLSHMVRDTDEPVLLDCFDQVTKAWMVWHSSSYTGVCPTWLVVAFQILVDTGERLGHHSPTSFDDLKEQAEAWLSRLRRDTRRGSNVISERLDKETINRVYSNIPAITKCILRSDTFQRIEKAAPRPYNSKTNTRTDGIVHHFLSHNPLLCGLQSWWLEQEYRDFEWRAVEIYESITPAAFLYISMRRFGLVPEWRDMEFVSQWP